MIKINISEEIEEKHYKTWSAPLENTLLVAKKLTSNNKEKEILENLLVEKTIKSILIGNIRELENLIEEVNKSKPDIKGILFKKIFPKIFDYNLFRNSKVLNKEKPFRDNGDRNIEDSSWNVTEFLKELNINTCPYCNRAYIFNKKCDGQVIPELDHYFYKSEYPYLGLSIYNLIPSCHLCNSRLKNIKDFFKNKHLHPYIDNFHKNASFIIEPDNLKGLLGYSDDFNIKIDFDKDTKTENYIETFKLKDLYNGHKDYIREILIKKIAYSDDWTTGICEKLNITQDEALRYYYGNYLNEDEINKRPLSKLTIDILDDLD